MLLRRGEPMDGTTKTGICLCDTCDLRTSCTWLRPPIAELAALRSQLQHVREMVKDALLVEFIGEQETPLDDYGKEVLRVILAEIDRITGGAK